MDFSDLSRLIDKGIDSADAMSVRGTLGKEKVDDKLGAPDVVYYSYPDTGISMVVERDGNRISTIFFANGENGPAYSGPLPAGVSYGRTKPEIEAALGTPTVTEDFWSEWELGEYIFRVEYRGDAVSDLMLKSPIW